MDLLFGYGAGLLTLINPCVLPVLPIILGSALREERLGPVALAAGLSATFVVLGVTVAAAGPAIGLDADRMAQIGAVAMICFGLVLMVPALNLRFAAATAGISSQAEQRRGEVRGNSLIGHFVGGMLLGAAWSPCIGPTLGGAISLASQGQSLGWATAIMASFALGTSTVILLLAYGTREAIMRRQESFRKIAANSEVGYGGRAYLGWCRDIERLALSPGRMGDEPAAGVAAGSFGFTLSFILEKENIVEKVNCRRPGAGMGRFGDANVSTCRWRRSRLQARRTEGRNRARQDCFAPL